MDLKKKEAAWSQFVNMIREECPHCRVENLVVVEGAVWGYQKISFSKVPPRPGRTEPAPRKGLDADWEWFIGECQELSNAIIPEVHFRDGRPIVVYGDKAAEVLTTINPLGGDRAGARNALALA